ncbi:MAG: peroxidase family protein [Bacteroidetes bacterium]|nr:MAG: peroxidase family protein [Bacteroidota bacterium]
MPVGMVFYEIAFHQPKIMTYISTNNDQPGIVTLLFYKPSTGRALSSLAHTLLHGPSPLTSSERELIASYVSWLNNCPFCHQSHGGAAICHDGANEAIIEAYKQSIDKAPVSPKMKALLAIAGKVQKSGKEVLPADIETARKAGASDEEIHDGVLIAAAFCMYNRYVDGLNTPMPEDPSDFADMGKRLAKNGYRYPNFIVRKFIIPWIEKRKKAKRK